MKHMRAAIGLVAAALLLGALFQRLAPTDPVLATVAVGPAPRSLVIDEAASHVFVSTVAQLGTVVVLDSASGALLHTATLGISQSESGVGAPALYSDTGTGQPMASLQDGTQLMLDPATGAVTRRLLATTPEPPWPVGGHPAHGLVVDPTTDTLLIEDMASRATVRRLPLRGRGIDATGTQQTQRLFLVDPTGALSVVDAYRGTVLHTFQTGATSFPPFAVSVPTGHLFVLAGTDTMLLVDIRTGRLIRTIHAAIQMPSPTGSPPLVFRVDPHGDHLWVGDADRQTLGVFSARTGALLYAATVGPTPAAVAADPRHGLLLVLCRGKTDVLGDPLSYGSLSVIDSRTGKVRRAVQVGVAPVAIAVDDRTSRAFILNANINPDLTPVHLQTRQSAWVVALAGLHRWFPFLPAARPATDQGTVTVLDTSRL